MMNKILKSCSLTMLIAICFLLGILFSKQSFENPTALTDVINEYLPEKYKVSKNAEVVIEKTEPVVQTTDEHFQSQLKAVRRYLHYESQIQNSPLTDEELVFEAESLLPSCVMDAACESEITCQLVDEIEVLDNGTVTGRFIVDDNNASILIRKRSKDVLDNIETTVLHEYGHFIDWYYEHKTGTDILENFRPICEEEFSRYLFMNEGYWTYNEDMLGEYFAEAFAYITFCNGSEGKEPILSYWKENTPNTYTYICEVIKALEEIEREVH